MPDFKELVKNLYTSKNRELTPEKLDYITKNYSGKEDDFVKNFYTTIGEDLTPDKLSYIKDTYLKKKDNIQRGYQFGSETLPIGSKPSQTQVDTSIPSVLNPKEATQYKEQVNIEAQKKRDLSQQLQSAKNVYYQAQGDANSFSLYDGYQSAIKNIDDEISKNYPDEATVSRTVSGQEDFKKYKTKRDELVSERERLRQESNNALLYINPKIESKINSDLKNNGLDSYTRNVNGFKVADEFKIDDYAKKIAEESGLANDGTFKQLVYNKLKSTVSSNIIKPKIEKEFNLESKKLGLDDAVQKEYLNNFIEGKKIQSNLILQVESLNNEIKTKVNDGAKSLLLEYKPIFESFTVDYKNKASELESKIKQLNDSYKSGIIPRQDYELSFNDIQNKLNLLNTEYQQGFESVSKDYLNSQNELYSKYDKKYKRQVSEFKSMADQQISDASKKYGKSFKMSDELNKKFQFAWSEATKKSLSKEEAIKYELDKTSLLNNIGGQFVKNLFMGIGGGIKSISSMYDFDTGYVLGDYMENSFVSSSPEIKSALDLLDPIKLQTSTGRMIGGMAPILGASALTAAATKNAPTALRLLTTGLGNYLIETAQIGGGVKDQVFQKTGNIADANKAAKKVIDANLYLLPLYALDGLPFLGNVTLGIGNTFARAGAKAGIEVITELPQEYFQGIFEDLAVANRPISQTFEEMSLERFENTALNVIPTSVLLGGGGTAIKGVRENISKIQGRSLAAKVNLSNLTETTKKQFIYDTVLRRGDVFSKAYVSSLFNSGNINEQELESFSKIIEDSSNINAESKKIGLNKAQSKVYAALRFDYLQSKNEFDSEQDEVSKKLYKAKMDSAEKSLTNYISGGKPDAVLLTLPNNEQYIYSFETLNSIINEGGETLNQIINGEISVGLLSDKSNPKAKELSDKLIQAKKDAIKIETAGEVPTATIGAMVEEDKVSDERLVQDVENYFTDNTRSTQDSKYNPDLSGEGELALQEQEDALLQLGADRIQAHGLAKGSIGQQFKDLINILTNGLDSRGDGQLYTAPLVMPAEMRAGAGAALGTGGGTAYTDGGFIILAREGVNEIRNVNDIGGVLVNQAIADTLPELIDRLKKAFPNISIESYSNAPKAIESIQSLEKLKPKENAIQVETAGEVPVQSKTEISGEVGEGKPKSEAEIPAEESVKAKEVENLPALNKQLKVLQDKFTRLEKKYEQTEDPAIQLQLDKINEESAVLSAKIEAIETKEQAPKTVEDEVQKLYALLGSPSGEPRFRLSDEVEEPLTSDVEAIEKEMNQMDEAELNFTEPEVSQKGLKVDPVSESNSLVKIAKKISDALLKPIQFFNGIPMITGMSDMLSAGKIKDSSGKAMDVEGGLLFNVLGKNKNAAWAGVTKEGAQAQYDNAVKLYNSNKELFDRLWSEGKLPDGHVPMAIMRMADTAVNSNEAVFRWVLPTIESLPKQNKINAMQAFIGSVQEKLNTKSKADVASATNILNFIKDKKITSLDQFFKEIISDATKRSKGMPGSQLKLDNRSLIYDLIFAPKGIKTASKPTIKALLSGTDNSKNKIFTSDVIYSSIGEPSMLKSKQGEVVSVVGIDVKNGGVISVDHGNYGFGPKGKTIALIENPTHGIDVFPEWKAKASRVFKKDKAGKTPSPEGVATQTGGAFFTDKAMRGAKVFADVISDINLLIGKIRFAFPSVSVSTTQEEFNNIINSPDVRTQVSDGKVILGLTKDGKIYLNPEMSSLQTPIHEFGHIWIDFLRSKESGKKGTDLLSKGLDLIKNTKEHKKAIEKYGNTEIALEEALVELMANKGATIIDAAKKSKFKSWMNATFKYIQDKFTTFKDLDSSKISKIKLDDFINIGLADLFSGKEVSAKFAPELSESAFKARMSAITDINEIVKIGLDNGISEEAIVKVLKDKNFNEKEISKAISKFKEQIIELPKLDESNVENAIELLDDIEDNKRKVERASSRMKANLEQKIAEAQSELDKIPAEAKIVKVINDNFDKIKKDLKEQGILNVKC